jgi:predicted Zn-dependent protease
LCREETEWLQNIESSKVVSFPSSRRRWLNALSVAAAFFFMALASILWWKQTQISQPDRQLRALASVKETQEIDFDSLNRNASPMDPTATKQYEEALALFKSHEFARAAKLFHAVLKQHPEHSASLYLLGYSYYKMDQAEKAFDLCQRAERIEPHSYERCMTLVHLALKTGHFDRALMEISALYHEAPDDPEIHRMYHSILSITKGRTLKM